VAHNTEQVGFPQLPLHAGMKIVLEARSPTTDAEVTGVTSSRWAIYGSDESAPFGDLEDVVPLLSAEELGGVEV
jgi:hypothetical protein